MRFPDEGHSISNQAKRNGVRVDSSVGTFEADLGVVAAGVGASGIARMIGLDVDPPRPATPGVIDTTEPLVNAVAYTSDTYFHQRDDGRVVIGEKAGPPQTDLHQAFLNGRPNWRKSTLCVSLTLHVDTYRKLLT